MLYEGHNCAGGKNELYLASMKCGVHYLVDNVRPRDDVPNYAIHGDRIVYADQNSEIVYIDVDAHALCGNLPGPALPVHLRARSGRVARHVAFAYAFPNPVHSVLYADDVRNWHWQPKFASPAQEIAPPHHSLDGWDSWFVTESADEIWLYDVHGATWSVLGKGHNPAISGGIETIAWEDHKAEGLWGIYNPAGIAQAFLANDGIQEMNPEVSGRYVAFEYFDPGLGNWQVAIHDLLANAPVATVPDAGNERNPDIFDRSVVYDVDGQAIRRYDAVTGTVANARLPSGCRQYTTPRLGNGDTWVVFAARNCVDGTSQLWLYDFSSGQLYFVDFLGNWGDPTYHILENKLVYIDDSDEAVYVEIAL